MKCALVTGGSRGIGKAICIELAKDSDYHILINYKSNQQAAQETLDEVIANGNTGELIPFSVDNAESVKNALDAWQEKNEDAIVEVLVNNAGITRDTLLMRMSEEQWDEVINVNLKSAFNLTKAVQRPMLKQRKGSIINMSSVVGVSGNAGQANYAASKAGMIGFTKSVGQELGSRNIRCNAIAPGFIETEMTGQLDEKVVQEWRNSIPLKRGGSPQDVADVTVFLASDKSAYVTGQVINVCGGMLM